MHSLLGSPSHARAPADPRRGDTSVRFRTRRLRPVPFFRRPRTHGFPPSGNGASSFHLGWRLPPGAGHLVAASVTLEVLAPPAGDHLYFWALQVAFPGAGAAHLGLQWNHRHPGFGAVNWGGYAADGSLLAGTESPLPSTPADPNTRDYPWQPRPVQAPRGPDRRAHVARQGHGRHHRRRDDGARPQCRRALSRRPHGLVGGASRVATIRR